MDYFYKHTNPFFTIKRGLTDLKKYLMVIFLVVFGLSNIFAQATWTPRIAPASGYNSVAYDGGSTFVVVQNGTAPATSPDGITWTARTAPSSFWTSVTYGGLFVAVSYSGVGVMTSPDGITWTTRTSPASPLWESVTYGGGLYVAVGPNRVMTSPDGITWTARGAAANNNWYGVTYGNGVFVAISTNGTSRVMTSANGTTWTSRTAAAANTWQKITFGNGLFVAVSSDGTNRVMTSPDGITWTSRSASVNNGWRAVVYGEDFSGNSRFVALAGDGVGNRVMSSPDGINWTTRASTSDIDWKGLGYGDGRFVAVAYGSAGIMTSDLVVPEINLQGNSVSIADGDITPSTVDNTNFGVVVVTGGTIARTFTIQNTGGDILNITSVVSNNAKFVISDAPTTIAASSSATFIVTYTSTGLGTDNATITVNNNDSDEAVYDFAITGRQINALPTGVRGSMLSLDGTDDRISIPHNATLNIGTSRLTLSAWVKRNVAGTFDNIIMKGNYGYGLVIDDQDRLGYWSEFSYTNCFNSGANTIPANVWTHVAVVVNAGVSTTLYINGVNVGTSTAPAQTVINNNTGILAFGVQDIGTCNCNSHAGNIDELQIWNTARTQAQIRENMHLTLSGTEAGLVSYYQFNETTGNVIDAVAGNNGALQNGATRISSDVAVAQGTAQRITPSVGLNTFTNANVAINFTTAPADEFVAYQLRGNPFNGVNALNVGTNTASCYWIIRQFGVGGVAYNDMNFTLPSNNTISTADVTTPSNLKLYKRPDNVTTAFPASFASATSANNTTKVVQFTGFASQTSFSQFEIGSTSSPLPITLLSFEGKRTNENNVLLQWKTATEINNKGFEIESSENATSFTKIAFVDGAGNSTNIKNYQFSIQNSDDAYYRLKQIDFDGSFSYSNIIFVKGIENMISVYPNPSTEFINIKTSKEGFIYEIFTLQGNSLIKNSVNTNIANVNINSFPKGIYFVHIIQNNTRVVKKIVVE